MTIPGSSAPSPADTRAERWRTLQIAPLRLRILCLLLLAGIAVGCPCIRGPVNASPALRWWLFSHFGAERICPEMLKRGVPLKLTAGGNTVGRFFPTRCVHQVNDQTQTVTIDFGGTGFAWTPVAGRVGFAMNAALEYRPDFYMTEDAVYVWGKLQRVVHGPEFQLGAVENKVVDWAASTPVGYLANTFGGQIVSSQLSSGFTVVRTDEGDEFALGILQPPARPKKPFDTSEGDRYVFANDTTEIRYDQLDFLGPFEVADSDQALFLRFRLRGNPVEAFVFPRSVADLYREGLQRGTGVGPLPQPPLQSFVIPPGQEMRRKIRLPRGHYVLMVDNTHALGTVRPVWNPLSAFGANSVELSYTAELGEEDDDF